MRRARYISVELRFIVPRHLTALFTMSSHTSPQRISLPSLHEVFPEHFAPSSKVSRGITIRDRRGTTGSIPNLQGHRADTNNEAVLYDISRAGELSRPRDSSIATGFLKDTSDARSIAEMQDDEDYSVISARRNISSDEHNGYPRATAPSHVYQSRSPTSSPVSTHSVSTRRRASVNSREDEKKHQCPYCPRRFNRPSSLAIHFNTHTGARPYECPKCGRHFSVNSNMRRHYRNHGSSPTETPSPSYLAAFPKASPNSSFAPYLPRAPDSHSYSYQSDSDHDGSHSMDEDAVHTYPGYAGEGHFARFRLGSSYSYGITKDPNPAHGMRPRSASCNIPNLVSTTLRPSTYQ